MSGDESVTIREHTEDLDGNICFHCTTPDGKDLQILRLEPNGDIYIHGRQAESDVAIVAALREFLKGALFPGSTGELVHQPGFEIIRRLQRRVHVLEKCLWDHNITVPVENV